MKNKKINWLKILAWIIGILLGLIALPLFVAVLVYPYEYVRRIVSWRESDVGDYLYNFPSHSLEAAPTTFRFKEDLDEERIEELFENILDIDDFEGFLEGENTLAFIVIQEDQILYEKYFDETQRESLVTSYSVAKSFASALIGIAIEEGYINSVNDPITDYLPELSERDSRFKEITIRHLLLMASGLEFQEDRWALFNGDGALTTYYPDQRRAALEFTHIIDPPGEYFLYNKYHPQLLGLILERTTGMSVSEYLQQVIWDPIGMEFGGSMSIDSEESDFEKMEAGINARAIDFAKFGRLFLKNGEWNGVQVIPVEWVAESTQPDRSVLDAAYYTDDFGQTIFDDLGGYYKYMWYGYLREGSDLDFTAQGDRGQYIYVSPFKNLIIVRNATAYGELSIHEWMSLIYQFASEL